MTTKEIEEYINTYRMYPDEYSGIRDNKILEKLNQSYRYNVKDNTITRLEGYIDNNGDFVLGETYTFPIDNPSDRRLSTTSDKHFKFKLNKYNVMMNELGYPDSVVTDEINKDWNLRDMVAEADYIRSLYVYGGPKSSLKKTDNPRYTSELARLHHFLRANRNNIDHLTVTVKHNSKYDNMEVDNE